MDYQIEKINGFIIRKALLRNKPNKSDPIYQFASDFMKGAPDLYREYLASLVGTFFTHGYIPSNLLTAIIPKRSRIIWGEKRS